MLAENNPQRTVLVTGGTAGLGVELVRWHRHKGDKVIAIGSRAEEDAPADFQYPPRVTYIRCDLSEPDSDQRVSALLHEGKYILDVVYLNAARGYWGEFSKQTTLEMESLLRITLLSPILLLKAIHHLIAPTGTVKIISSIARYLPNRNYALYAAAKAAVSECMASLIFEKSAQYRVSVIHPGAIATTFHRKSGMTGRRAGRGAAARGVARAVVRRKGIVTVGVWNQPWRLYGTIRDILSVVHRRVRRGASRARAPGTVMIIGAAEGMGLEIAKRYMPIAKKLVLIDSNRALLEQNCRHLPGGEGVVCVEADVRLSSGMRLIEQQVVAADELSHLFLTAAVSAVGPFHSIPRQALLDVYAVNCLPAAHLIRLILSANTPCRMVLFSSLSAFVHYPGAAMYSATKSFLSTLTRALGTRHDGMMLSAVYPGAVGTRHASRYSPDNTRAPSRLPANRAAKSIVRQVSAGNSMIFLRTMDRLVAIAALILPRLFGHIMRAVIYKKITVPLLPPSGGE